MKKACILIVLYLIGQVNGNCQLAGNVSLISPTGDLGFLMKKAPGYELTYSYFNSSENVRTRYSLGYIGFKSRLDTFLLTQPADITGKITPGYEVISHFSLMYASGGQDYFLFTKHYFSIYPGWSVLSGYVNIHDHSVTVNEDATTDAGSYFIGGELRFGADYQMSDVTHIFFDVGRTYFFTQQLSVLNFTKYSLGFDFEFDG